MATIEVPSALGTTAKGAPKPLTPLQRRVDSIGSFETPVVSTPAPAVPTRDDYMREINAQRDAERAATPEQPSSMQSFMAGLGYTGDIVEAVQATRIRNQASKDVDPNWDVGTKRQEFRRFPQQFWASFENTQNQSQYDALVQVMNNKDERQRVAAANPIASTVSNFLDPTVWLTGFGSVATSVKAARAWQLSKTEAVLLGGTMEGSLNAGISAGTQIAETGDVYNKADVATAFAVSSLLHFGAQAAFTRAEFYKPRVDPVTQRIEPGFGPMGEIWMSEAGVPGEAALTGGMRATYDDAVQRMAQANENIAAKAEGWANELPPVSEPLRAPAPRPSQIVTPEPVAEGAVVDARIPTQSGDLNTIMAQAKERMTAARAEFPEAFKKIDGFAGTLAAGTSSLYKIMRGGSDVMKDAALRMGESSTGWFRGLTSGAAVDRESYVRLIRDPYSQVRNEALAYAKRTGQGGNLGLTTQVEREFNAALRNEMEARWLLNARTDAEAAAEDAMRWANVAPEVKRAADQLDIGNQRAAKLLAEADPRYADLVGRRGYVSRVIDGDMLASLPKEQLDGFRRVLGRQVLKAVQQSQKAAMRAQKAGGPRTLITARGANSVADAMINRAMAQVSGSGGSTIGLFDRAARDEIENILKSRGMQADDIEYTFALLDKRLDAGSGSSRLRDRMDMDLFDVDEITGVRLMDMYRNDMSNLSARYADEMGGRVALSHAGFKGDNDLEQVIQAAFHEGGETGEALSKQADELRFMYNQMLGRVSNGQNSRAAVGMLTQVNALQNLQQVGFAQLAETAQAAAMFGIGATLRHVPALAKIVGGARENALPAREAQFLKEMNKMMGPIGEHWRTHRISTEVNESLTNASQKVQVVDSALKSGQHLAGWISGMHHLMEWQTKMVASNASVKFAEAAFKGEKLNKRLVDAGFNESSWARVQDNIKAHARNEAGQPARSAGDVFDLNIDAWDAATARDFTRTIERTAGQLIQRDFTGESARWMQDDLGRMLLSLRSYPVKALNKQLMRNLSIGDAQTAMLMGYGFAFSTLAYVSKTYVQSLGREDQDDFLERRLSGDWLYAGVIGYASMGTIMPDLLRPVQSWYVGEDEEHRRLDGLNVLTSIVPGISPIERVGSALYRAGDAAFGIAQGDDRNVYSDSTARRDIQAFFGNSVPVALTLNTVFGGQTD